MHAAIIALADSLHQECRDGVVSKFGQLPALLGPCQCSRARRLNPGATASFCPLSPRRIFLPQVPLVAVKQTPLIAQYLSVKQRVPDAILFFRLGDFYEMFFEDAEVGARVLDIQLTSRNKDGVPLCGVPYHSAEPYIAKLLKAGHKVAICEQGTPDAKSPKLMPRQIVRVITPGTVGEEMVLTAAEKNYLLAIVHAGDGFAIAALDVSTGEFLATQIRDASNLVEEVARIAPREIVIAGNDDALNTILRDLNCPVTTVDHELFTPGRATAAISSRFPDAAPALHESIVHAAGIALNYVEETF